MQKIVSSKLVLPAAMFIALIAFNSRQATAEPIALQNATATYSQRSFEIDHAIDNLSTLGPGNIWGPLQPTGWAISGRGPNRALSQIAVFETNPSDVALLVNGLSTLLVLTLDFQYEDLFWGQNSQKFNLGRFRVSVTTDDRSTFADSLPRGGDVTANWTVLDPSSISSTDVTTSFIKLFDNSLLANPDSPNLKQTYTVMAETTLTDITGIRLEVLEHGSLARGGPGRFPLDGNFVLTNFELEASSIPGPEPTTAELALTRVEVAFNNLPNTDSFRVKGGLTLGVNSNGIDPVNEVIIITLGTTTVTIPLGFFIEILPGEFSFQGMIDSVYVEMTIQERSIDTYRFDVFADSLDLTDMVNPVSIDLNIGDDAGASSVRLGGTLKFTAP